MTSVNGATSLWVTYAKQADNVKLRKVPTSCCAGRDGEDQLPLGLIGNTLRAFREAVAVVTKPGHGSFRYQLTR